MRTHRDSHEAYREGPHGHQPAPRRGGPRKTRLILAGLVTLSLGGGTAVATMLPAATQRPLPTDERAAGNRAALGITDLPADPTTTGLTTTGAPATTTTEAAGETTTTTTTTRTTTPQATTPTTTVPKPVDPGLDPVIARAIQLTNEHRTRNGCTPLTTDRRLSTAADRHSADMAANGYFSHTSQDGRSFADRLRSAGYPQPGGENIAQGARTAEQVVKMWMESPGHRANILNCDFKTIGMGVDTRGWYWTQNFGW